MPVAYEMAREAWLGTAMIFGPLALLALLILDKRRASKTGRASTGASYPVCTENLIRVEDVMESPKLAE